MSEENESDKSQEVPFYYTSKASRSERDLGCEHLFWRQEGNEWIKISETEYKKLENAGERVTTGCIHPTCKPSEVMEWLIEVLSDEGDRILDPFAGSGTTGIAAMKTGRSCDLVELNETGVYQDIIEGRLHGNAVSLKEDPQYADRYDIEFSGEISDNHPAKLEDEISFGDLFNID